MYAAREGRTDANVRKKPTASAGGKGRSRKTQGGGGEGLRGKREWRKKIGEGEGERTVDAAVGTVGAAAHLGGAVRLDVFNDKLIRGEALDLHDTAAEANA